MKNNIDSLVIDLPCLPEINGEFETSKNERLALYDIIITAFRYKYEYEKAKGQRKEFLFKNQNLNDMKVYSFFLNKINTSIRDKFLRKYRVFHEICNKMFYIHLLIVSSGYETSYFNIGNSDGCRPLNGGYSCRQCSGERKSG